MTKDGRRRNRGLAVDGLSFVLGQSAVAAAVAGEDTRIRKGSLTMSTPRLHLHHLHLLGLVLLCIVLLALGLPGATLTQAAGNGEDYASNELNNPWDMDGP